MRMIQGQGMEQGMQVPVTAGAAGIGLAISRAFMAAGHTERLSPRQMVVAKDIADMILLIRPPAGATIAGQSLSVCRNVETPDCRWRRRTLMRFLEPHPTSPGSRPIGRSQAPPG